MLSYIYKFSRSFSSIQSKLFLPRSLNFWETEKSDKENKIPPQLLENKTDLDNTIISSNQNTYNNNIINSSSHLKASSYNHLPGINQVNDLESAKKVLKVLESLPEETYHAIDTEVVDIEIRKESPVGHGVVICASIFCGPDIDFGNGPRIWIDNLDQAQGTLQYFKDYFANNQKKVWHNYSFDRHVLENHNLSVGGFAGDTMHMARLWNSGRIRGYSLEALTRDLLVNPKISYTERFATPRILKNNSYGKTLVVPPVIDLQRLPQYRRDWIDYSVYDAESTWLLRNILERELRKIPWNKNESSMWDFYVKVWMPFGKLLVDMEQEGINVDITKLQAAEKQAHDDIANYAETFIRWASKYCPDAKYMNLNSDAQKQQFFFAPAILNGVPSLPEMKIFTAPNVDNIIQNPNETKPSRNIKYSIKGLGMPVSNWTNSNKPSANSDSLKKLAGSPLSDPPKYGDAYEFFQGEEGIEASIAIDSLVKYTATNTILDTFITPLQQLIDSSSRIHCSMNLNTETGRLSCRTPNLQNQPSGARDTYKIRSSFCAKPGHKLIVADYGQLELRVLAHITHCKSMIEAFKLGGDFHSRTALGMYPEIMESIEKGECVLEWDYSKGKCPVPLLKDLFSVQRKRAKILNFSIAYGMTFVGLSKEFGCSREEAKQTINKWYEARAEVRDWQKKVIQEAHNTQMTRTLMGRYRPLPQINSTNSAERSHNERAAINTPIQGGAADIVIKAMLNIGQNEMLRKLGWKLLLQIHDEVILEGPQESAEEAFKIVINCMEHPFKKDLLVDLIVDGKICDNWTEGK